MFVRGKKDNESRIVANKYSFMATRVEGFGYY